LWINVVAGGMLQLYVVKESDELRYTFNARPVYVRPTSDDFLK